MIRIVLVEDHLVVRQGLLHLLGEIPGFRVIGQVGEAPAAVELLDDLEPDVAVVDLGLPGASGLEVLRHVRDARLQTACVVLSMHADPSYVLRALRFGARGYVLKDAGSDELVRGIREAVAGRRHLSPPLSEETLHHWLKASGGDLDDPFGELTPREREIAHLSIEGLTAPEVADRLGISPRTVETHRTNLHRKLGVHSQTELLHLASRHGLLPPG